MSNSEVTGAALSRSRSIITNKKDEVSAVNYRYLDSVDLALKMTINAYVDSIYFNLNTVRSHL